MKVEVLGSGGSITIPVPFCKCHVCVEAKEKGTPYERTGPSIFVHGPDILIDTPEEIKKQLNKSSITNINGCFYSHWHPDHVAGLRVWETMNKDFRHYPPKDKCTDIYLPEQVYKDFKKRLGYWDHFSYLKSQNVVHLHLLSDGEKVTINEYTITPFRLAEDYVYAFIIEGRNKTILLAPDELKGWSPPLTLMDKNIDLAILPMGLNEVHPVTGIRKIPSNHPVLSIEATFHDTLQIINQLKPKRTILTHIEEPDGLSYSDLLLVEKQYKDDGLIIEFAYDGMLADI